MVISNIYKAKRVIIGAAILGSFAITTSVSAVVSHPAPYPLVDEWNVGTSDNYGWSNYIIKTGWYGSSSSVKNIYGSVKSKASTKYGWANSSSSREWYDVRLDGFWGYWRF